MPDDHVALLGVTAHVEALAREGKLLVGAARRTELGAPVPTCPGWSVRDLLAHLGFVHRWARAYVAESLTEMVEEPDEAAVLAAAPPDEVLVDWLAVGHAALVRALRDAPPDLDCWTFLPAPSPLSFWARRQAHETAVHRVDAELAALAPVTPFEPAFAGDGLAELVGGFLSRGRAEPDEGEAPGWTLRLEAADCAGASFSVRVFAERAAAAPGGPGDVTVRGPASDLYLLAWNRRRPDGLEVSGRSKLLDGFAGVARVTWA